MVASVSGSCGAFWRVRGPRDRATSRYLLLRIPVLQCSPIGGEMAHPSKKVDDADDRNDDAAPCAKAETEAG
jgi:hypothetical protein